MVEPPDEPIDDPRALIVTARFDALTFERLDRLRQAHFPPALNHLPAHLTLFHHLPGLRLREVVASVARAATCAPIALEFPRLRSLGRGVALEVTAPALMEVRAEIARAFAADLTPQDRQGFRPHVTVQNKVASAQARALLDELGGGFVPWSGTATGLLIWRYLGGPWSLLEDIPFIGTA